MDLLRNILPLLSPKSTESSRIPRIIEDLSVLSLISMMLAVSLLSGCAAGRRLTSDEPVEEAPYIRFSRTTWNETDYRGLADQVEIIRTSYGVPHIKAENLRALGFGMAWCQLEDYGARVAENLVVARGEAGLLFGSDGFIDSDVLRRRFYARAVETYHLLHEDVRDMLEGFASGVNFYITLHPEEFPDWPDPDFTGHDVSALNIGGSNTNLARTFLRQLSEQSEPPSLDLDRFGARSDVGSNVWAFGPSRTTSGNSILLRNPHLSWDAGYYEAHLIVPGELDFYGDIRIGRAFSIIGGFNRHLGWSTTNNYPDLDEIYELDLDPNRDDHYLFDGASLPLISREVTVEYTRQEGGAGRASRVLWETPIGPVIHRTDSKAYIMRSANDGEYRRGEQYLCMMQAGNLEEWKDAMSMRAFGSSNYTYADSDGNIFYIWNAKTPVLSHEAKDSEAVAVRTSSEIWTSLLPFEDLPQLLNPEGGYLQNANDPPNYTNLNAYLDPSLFPENVPEPRLGLRSQHSLSLVHGDSLLSLEDVVELKHSMRMLLAERVKEDMLEAVRSAEPDSEMAAAADHLEAWDNTVARDSRGGVLFEAWWQAYVRSLVRERIERGDQNRSPEEGELYAVPWTPENPVTTPRGIARPDVAVQALADAIDTVKERWGGWDLAWGEVHRVRRGDVDVPVGGGSSGLGCFRVLGYTQDTDGKLVAGVGDGWVLVVEFSDPPRAYSILAYGQSAREDSPHYSDQAEMFARNEMKRVAFTEEEIEAQVIRRYRPGRR